MINGTRLQETRCRPSWTRPSGENDFVLMVCTPRSKLKADGGLGGVGFEGDVILGPIFTTSNHRKFISALRKREWSAAAPSALLGKFWIDLREGPD